MDEESQQSNSATENKEVLRELLLRGLAKLKADLDSVRQIRGFTNLLDRDPR